MMKISPVSFGKIFDIRYKQGIGTKAEVKAPSANRLRNKFGSLNATKNASETRLAPRKLAKTISRKNPVMRDNSVKLPKVAMDLNKFMINCDLNT